jgi:hypothetical protein
MRKPREIRDRVGASVGIMGFDFWADIDFTLRQGSHDYWDRAIGVWLPGDPPDYEIHGITLHLDEPGHLGPGWKLDGAQLELIAEHDAVRDAVTTFSL